VHRRPYDGLEEHNEEREPERYAASRSIEPRRAFAQRLEDPACPTISLLDEIEVALGRLGVGDRALLVRDVPAGRQQLESEIGVFGESIGVVAAGANQRVTPKDTNGTGNDVHDAEKSLRAPRRVQPFDVLERLQSRPEIMAI